MMVEWSFKHALLLLCALTMIEIASSSVPVTGMDNSNHKSIIEGSVAKGDKRHIGAFEKNTVEAGCLFCYSTAIYLVL